MLRINDGSRHDADASARTVSITDADSDTDSNPNADDDAGRRDVGNAAGPNGEHLDSGLRVFAANHHGRKEYDGHVDEQ